MTLSIVMITYNSADVVEGAMKSVAGLWDELLVGDGGSTDGTVEMVKRYGAKVIRQIRPRHQPSLLARLTAVPHKSGGAGQANKPRTKNLGERKQELVEKAKGDWILVLDADERVSPELVHEIRRVTAHHKIRLEHKNVMDPRLRGDDRRAGGDDKSIVAYRIPYQNYVFGRPVYYGGEKYAKVRLFRRGTATISPEPLHEEIILSQELPKARPSQRLRPVLEDGNVGELHGVIHHHSYRTPWQLFSKFTRYAWIAAGMIVENEKEKTLDSRVRGNDNVLKTLFLYGPHMFWARFIKEKGYKDGWRGMVLAAAFGYMEGLTYWFVFIRSLLAVLQGETFKHL